MYIDKYGKEYKSRSEYANSLDLEPEEIYLFLLSGERTPQNADEIEIKRQMDEIQAKGGKIDTNLNF